ncbi:MAG: FUSC family membrane protein, partial [Gemmatimonadota bacterium]
MPPLREPVRQMREVIALAPGKPAWPAGLRAAIATVAPLVAGSLLGSTGGTWMSLAGFTGALADRGGPYRSRAAATGVLTLAGSVAVAIGTLSAGSLWVTVPVTFLFALGCSLARVWGISGATVGSSVLNIYVIALAYPAPSPREALTRAGYVVVGGLWAMFVSLILWPLRPFRPIRLAVAEGYRRLALYADGLALNAEGNRAHSGEIPVAGAQVREALEQARGALTRARRGVPGESGRGEKLLVLEEMADRLFGYLVGLSDMAATVADEQRDAAAQHALAHVFTALAATVRGVATQIEAEGNQVLVQVEWNGHALRALLDHAAAEIPDSAAGQYQQAALLIDRLSQYAGAAAATAATLNDGTSAPTSDIPFQPEPPRTLLTILGPVRAVLAPDSVVLRYALRMAIVVTVAVLLTGAIGLKRGYWVTITIVIILQPYTGATTIKALQRVAGTVLGGLLTAGLG